MKKVRKDAGAEKMIRLSVPIDRRLHARIQAASTLRGILVSELAGQLIRKGLAGVTVVDNAGSTEDEAAE
jgi:hypothetical protein